MSSLVISNCPVMPTSVAHNRAWSSVSGGRTQTTSGSVQKQWWLVKSQLIVAAMAGCMPCQSGPTSPPMRIASQ